MCHIPTIYKYLQTVTATLGDAFCHILVTRIILNLFETKQRNRIVINIDFNEILRKMHINLVFNEDFVVYSRIRQRNTIISKEHHYKSLFVPDIDCVIQEFNTRLSDEVLSLMVFATGQS